MSNKKKSLILFKHNAITESFKRPDHEDFATTAELKDRKFSGYRNNSISGAYEIWIDGEIVKEVSLAAIAANPMALSDAHADVFKLPTIAEMAR